MSGPRLSIIPARAATDRALKPRDLQVLCVLGRHTDDFGWCRRSQVKMADEMGCARSTVFEAIERLVASGYLERHEQNDPSGRDSAHVYRVVLDPVHPDVAAVREGGDPAGQPAPPAGISAPPAGPGPAPINDPLLTNERARGREGEEGGPGDASTEVGEDRRGRDALERRFWKLVRSHPQSAGVPKDRWLAEWLRLTPDEQDRAESRHPAWLALLKRHGKDHVAALSTYFAQKLFDEVPARDAVAPPALVAKPFGPLWAADRIALLLRGPAEIPPPSSAFLRRLVEQDDSAGRKARLERQARYGFPKVRIMDERADHRRGVTVEPWVERLAPLMEPVPVGCATFEDWRAEFEKRGWPWLPDPGGQPGVFFPAGGPARMDDFEAAARSQAPNGDETGGNDADRPQAAE